MFISTSGNKAKVSAPPFLISISLEVTSSVISKVRKETQHKHTGKGEVKLFLFTDGLTTCEEYLKESTKKLSCWNKGI